MMSSQIALWYSTNNPCKANKPIFSFNLGSPPLNYSVGFPNKCRSKISHK